MMDVHYAYAECLVQWHVMALPEETNKLGDKHGFIAGLRLQCKYKGHSNRNTQIRASFAADGQSIICGSDDGHVYIWNTHSQPADGPVADAKKVCYHL